MKKSIFTISSFFVLATGALYAQQEKLLTHFIYDKMTINPGSTGLESGFTGTMVYRNQWDKVNGAPNSFLFNAEANMNRWLPGGLGLSFYHDAIGEMRQNSLLLNYSYPVRIFNQGTLGVGLGLGLVNVGFDPQWVPPTNTPDPLLPPKTSASNIDFNFGLYYRADAGYYFGVSATHINESKITNNVNYTNARNIFAVAGYRNNNGIAQDRGYDAQFLLRTDMVKTSAEINLRYLHSNIFYGGLTYRVSDGVGFMLGYHPKWNNPKIGFSTVGYSYDLTLNKLSDISRGSHEIVIRHTYLLPDPPKELKKHPRWL